MGFLKLFKSGPPPWLFPRLEDTLLINPHKDLLTLVWQQVTCTGATVYIKAPVTVGHALIIPGPQLPPWVKDS